MTTVPVPSGASRATSPGTAVGAARLARTQDPVVRAIGVALGLVALGLVAFLGYVGVVSDLVQHRAQDIAFTQFRNNAYLATQPVQYVAPPTAVVTPGQPSPDIVPSLASGVPVGLLQIPELRLSQVVLEGTDGRTLMDGPGHRVNTALPGQAGASYVYGRRATFGGPFADVARLPRGAQITVTTGQGTSVYRVTRVRRAGDPLPPALAAGAGRLTLETAGGTPYLPTSAVFVDATLDLSRMAGGAAFPSGARSVVSPREAAFASDLGAVLPLLLWGFLLLICSVAFSTAWVRWGRTSTWLVGAPVVLAVAWQVAQTASRLLPNLM